MTSRDCMQTRKRRRECDATSSCSTVSRTSEPLKGVSEESDDSSNEASSSQILDDPEAVVDSPGRRRAMFEAKYLQYDLLGEGGCGSVFAGFREEDNLPVAIKRISRDSHICTHYDESRKLVFTEIAIMNRAWSRRSGSVALLDWYLLEDELVLVMERPVPSMDLFTFINTRCKRHMTETKAKVIMKQLVDAALALANRGVCHRDIKTENILIQTDSSSPRIHLIDFGYSVFAEKNTLYNVFYGTAEHLPPEWFSRSSYRAEPLTVWQVGVVLYEILHKGMFETQHFLQLKRKIRRKLSEGCQDFLNKCLTTAPELRPTLDQLRYHPWIQGPGTK